MTSQQILLTDPLDLLFEKRNKLYGAYLLRKTYPKHLILSIFLTLCTVGLLIYFLSGTGGQQLISNAAEKVVVVEHFIPPTPKEKPKPTQPRQASPMQALNQRIFTNNITISDKPVSETLAAVTDLENLMVSNATSSGTVNSTTIPPPKPVVTTTIGGTEKKQELKEVKPDRQAQFPGGREAWTSFLNRHLHSPEELEPGEKRTVLISFEVSEEGAITDFIILQSAGDKFDKEVMRVLKKMPRWLPALQQGQPVPVNFTQPVSFLGVGNW